MSERSIAPSLASEHVGALFSMLERSLVEPLERARRAGMLLAVSPASFQPAQTAYSTGNLTASWTYRLLEHGEPVPAGWWLIDPAKGLEA